MSFSEPSWLPAQNSHSASHFGYNGEKDGPGSKTYVSYNRMRETDMQSGNYEALR